MVDLILKTVALPQKVDFESIISETSKWKIFEVYFSLVLY